MIISSKQKRVPVVLQMSAADCGSACLTMILRYWGNNITSRACHTAMGGGRNGVTALMIVNAARELGLDVQAFRHTPEGVAQATLPAIIHWQGAHFVVLESWTEKGVQIVDPAMGRRTLTHTAFAEKFSGVTLTMTPATNFAKALDRQAQAASLAVPVWRTYVRRVLAVPGSRQMLILLVGASVLLQLSGLVLPAVTWLVVEQILPDLANNGLGLIGGIALLAGLAHAAVVYSRSHLAVRLQSRLDSHLMPDFFIQMLRLPTCFFQQKTTGDLISRLEGNAAVREMITSGILTGLLDGGLALLYLIILYAQAPLFGVVVTSITLIQIALLAYTSEQIHEYSQIALATQAEEDGFAVQVLRGVESVKAVGAEGWVFEQWHRRFDATLEADVIRSRYVARVNSTLQFMTFITPLLLFWIGAQLLQMGQLSLGQMLGLVVLATTSLAPLGSLATYYHRAQQIWAYFERLADVLETPPEEEADAPFVPVELMGGIQVSNLSFCYSREDVNRGDFGLQDVSFEVLPGEKVAIVGPSGAGKSTLIRLLLGMYRPDSGQIKYDGRPIAELGLTPLRQAIGVVLQDSFLLSGSIRENIALHQPEMPLSQVIAAAKLAAIHAEIERLPMGYETPVGEGGSGLSGGQRQRVALARALANRPTVLLLDEATSHLDSSTEGEIQQGLDDLQATRLIIAHRLSTVRNADRVLVMQKGRIVEAGRPDVLLAQDGVYSCLLKEQNGPARALEGCVAKNI